MICFTEILNLRFCKSNKFCQFSCICHREFSEHIQSRMGSVFFNSQNSRHIYKMDISFIFQKIPKKIQILLLSGQIILTFPQYTVPFIYQNNKAPSRFCIDILHSLNQIFKIKIIHMRIFPFQFTCYQLYQQFQHFQNMMSSTQELLHIQCDNIIPVQIIMKIRTVFNFQSIKQCFRITSSAIICSQHVCRHGLSKPTGSADTDTFL